MNATKTCRACEQDKPLDAFLRHAFAKDGRVHTCTPCRRIQADKRHADILPPPPAPRRRPDLPRPAWGWQNDAACAGKDLVLFYGPEGERQPEREVRQRKARSVCLGCPVQADCLDYAISRPEKYGTWGGLNEDQRAAERRRRIRRENAA